MCYINSHFNTIYEKDNCKCFLLSKCFNMLHGHCGIIQLIATSVIRVLIINTEDQGTESHGWVLQQVLVSYPCYTHVFWYHVAPGHVIKTNASAFVNLAHWSLNCSCYLDFSYFILLFLLFYLCTICIILTFLFTT